MQNISYMHYKNCLLFYLVCYIAVILFMILLPILDSSFWVLYLILISIIGTAMSPFIIISLICLIKSKKSVNGNLYIGTIIGFESTFSVVPMPRMALKVKLPNGDILITGGVIKASDMSKFKNKEIQISKKDKKIYCLMLV